MGSCKKSLAASCESERHSKSYPAGCTCMHAAQATPREMHSLAQNSPSRSNSLGKESAICTWGENTRPGFWVTDEPTERKGLENQRNARYCMACVLVYTWSLGSRPGLPTCQLSSWAPHGILTCRCATLTGETLHACVVRQPLNRNTSLASIEKRIHPR
jgi:hypothetical protein